MSVNMAFRRLGALAPALLLAACGPTGKAQWTSHPPNPSPFSATLYEDTYDSGGSIIYRLRFDRTERGPGGGWFVEKHIDGDSPRPRRPDLVWKSPKDLTVIVHTARMEGRIVQRFVNQAGDDGSLTLDYRADGLEQ